MSEIKASTGAVKPKTVALDELLPRLGHPGKFQVITFLLLALNYLSVAFNHVCMAFYGSTPKHKCHNSAIEAGNSTFLGVTYGKCVTSYFMGNGPNTTITCKSDPNGMWTFASYTDRETTIITEGLQTATVALVMELAVREYRGMAGAVFECYWGAGVLLLAGIAYFIQIWRYIQLAISLPPILLVFSIW